MSKMVHNAIFLDLFKFFVPSIKVYVVLIENFVLTNSEWELLPPGQNPLLCYVRGASQHLYRQGCCNENQKLFFAILAI